MSYKSSELAHKGVPNTEIIIISMDIKALFSSPQKTKTFQDSPSHRILRHMHGALNIDENKN